MEVVVALIQQLNSAVFTLIAVLIVMFIALYKAGGLVKTFGVFKEKNDKIDDKIDSIKDSLSQIRATTDLLYQAHLTTIKSSSPVKLTLIGEEVASAISVKRKVGDHWEQIKQKLQQENPQNPYDIQVIAMKIARECFDDIFSEQERNEIKTFAFVKGMNLLEIYPVIGIEIRNRVLTERNISLGDIDKHDPHGKKSLEKK